MKSSEMRFWTKEIILGLEKSVDKLAEDMKENTASRRKEELGTYDASVLKMKEKMEEETKSGPVNEQGWTDKRKYKSNNRKKVTLWEDLERRMFDHFQPTGEGSLGAWSIKIKQDETYTNYMENFLNYSAPLPEMAKSVLMDESDGIRVEVTSGSDKSSSAELGRMGGQKGNEAQMRQITIPLWGNYAKKELQSRGCLTMSSKHVLIRETKQETIDNSLIKVLWSSKDIGWSYIESNGRSGGMLTSRVGALSETIRAESSKDLGWTFAGSLKEFRGSAGKILWISSLLRVPLGIGKIVDELNLLVIDGARFGVTIGDKSTVEGQGICKRKYCGCVPLDLWGALADEVHSVYDGEQTNYSQGRSGFDHCRMLKRGEMKNC
ncbi:retrotransposon protein [Cucumis melo var. makuwa]|uniref:Retrotransposon protein n=1 Tax=Cucumis melo var. makuwa TaxID=1194695 RepID=A0A5A7TEB6_CUCMM|nr:retrotransposon protein [Cucumis melo var. makuwa]